MPLKNKVSADVESLRGCAQENKPQGFESWLFIHETEAKNRSGILLHGFRIPKSDVIICGVYVQPELWKAQRYNDMAVEFCIKLKPDAKILWTDTDKPIDFVLCNGGNAAFKEMYADCIKKTIPSNIVKIRKIESNVNVWFAWKRQFSREVEKWLMNNEFNGVQQGGEVVITDVSCIEYVKEYER